MNLKDYDVIIRGLELAADDETRKGDRYFLLFGAAMCASFIPPVILLGLPVACYALFGICRHYRRAGKRHKEWEQAIKERRAQREAVHASLYGS